MLFISSSWITLYLLKIICLGRRGKKQKDKKQVKEYVDADDDFAISIRTLYHLFC